MTRTPDLHIPNFARAWRTPARLLCMAAMAAVLMAPVAGAQLAGKGAVQGIVTDASGAVVPQATIVATNDATGVSTTTTSTSAGDYSIQTLDPGIYTLVISAPGFTKIEQKNVHINALESQTYSPKLAVGSETQTVTVSSEPPQLETSNATLGATIEQEMYNALPIEMGAYGQPDQRRATDFAFLMPGVQGNNTSGNATTNTGIVNGSGSRGAVSAVYIDGVAFVRAGGQGDPRYVWTAISVDAVDQFQLQTSGYSAIYEGQGVQNYTVKAGGNKFHGSIYEFFRNTALDTYGWAGSVPNPATGKVVKPVEHSNEYGINLSGPLLPFGSMREKLFFFGNYNGFRYASATPTPLTFPNSAQQAGDFSAAGINIYDPATQATCTANNGGVPCRYQFGYGPVAGGSTAFNKTNPGNAGLTGAPVNVIPAARISALSAKLQSYLPGGIGSALQNNYVSQNRTGLTNWSHTERIDYVVSSKNTITAVAAFGRQASSVPVGQGVTSGRNTGPVPYNYGQAYAPKTAVGILEDTHTFSPHVVNQIKYGYARYYGPTFDADQLPAYAASGQGFSGLPGGAAAGAFPITTFNGTNAPTQWGGTGPGITNAQNYTLVDNVQWTKGKHSFTFGAQIAWLLYNVTNATGGTTPLTIANSTAETSQLAQPASAGTVAYTAQSGTGLSYASFLLGDYDRLSFTQYGIQVNGVRFRPISPYVQDNWKVTQRLTLDLGLRYDFFPTITEVHDAMSYFDPNVSNPVTGLKGGLQFTGTGAGTCNCRTPVNNYYKNFGPRIGAAYQLDPKTVLRASYGVMFTHGNAVGGSSTSLGSSGFSVSPSTGPNGVLTPGSTSPYTGTFPTFAPPSGVAAGPAFNTGNLSTSGYTSTSPSGLGYADPYLGGRAPEYINYTFGMQHQWSNFFTSTMTYVGSQGHFLPTDGGNPRGYYSDQLDPKYLALGSTLAISGANLQTYCTNNAGVCPSNFAQVNSSTQLSQLLKPFPFQNVSDSFGYVGNSVYNSLQVSLNMRPQHGFSFMVNYTWGRAIDDGGTFRTGYAIPAGTVFNNPNSYAQDRIERTVSTTNQPHHLVVTGVTELPFGKRIFNQHEWQRAIFGGFKFSEIFQAFSGSPLAITASSCPTNPAQSTCLPYLNPNWNGSDPRIPGPWGAGAVADTTKNPAKSFIVPSVNLDTTGKTCIPSGPFVAPTAACLNSAYAPSYTLSNSPRTAPYHLTGPGNYQLDIALVRSFPLHITEASRLNFRAEMYNLTNHTFFAVASTQVGNAAFGTVTTSGNYNRRAAQFSARIEF